MPHKNSESRRAYNANYRAEHPSYPVKWYAEHRTEMRSYRAKYRADHRAERRAYTAKWQAENPEVCNAHTRNRRHRKRANGGNFTLAAWEHLKTLFGHCCAYCGRRMERLTQDHVIPISKGGWHCSMNIVPACQSCNSRKGVRSSVK